MTVKVQVTIRNVLVHTVYCSSKLRIFFSIMCLVRHGYILLPHALNLLAYNNKLLQEIFFVINVALMSKFIYSVLQEKTYCTK